MKCVTDMFEEAEKLPVEEARRILDTALPEHEPLKEKVIGAIDASGMKLVAYAFKLQAYAEMTRIRVEILGEDVPSTMHVGSMAKQEAELLAQVASVRVQLLKDITYFSSRFEFGAWGCDVGIRKGGILVERAPQRKNPLAGLLGLED